MSSPNAYDASPKRKLPSAGVLRDVDLHLLFVGKGASNAIALLSFLKARAAGCGAVVIRDRELATELGWSHSKVKRTKRVVWAAGLPVYGIREKAGGGDFTATKWVLDRRLVEELPALGEAPDEPEVVPVENADLRPNVGSNLTQRRVKNDPTYKEENVSLLQRETLDRKRSTAAAGAAPDFLGEQVAADAAADFQLVEVRLEAAAVATPEPGGDGGSDEEPRGSAALRWVEAEGWALDDDDFRVELGLRFTLSRSSSTAAIRRRLELRGARGLNGHRRGEPDPLNVGLPKSTPPADQRAA